MLKEVFITMKANKLRTFLTGFSIAWGIFMVVILIGAGNGFKNAIEEQFKSSGTANIIYTSPGITSIVAHGYPKDRKINFDTRMETMLAKNTLSEDCTPRVFLGSKLIRYGNEYGSFSLVGSTKAYMQTERVSVSAGRFITDRDLKTRAKVVVLGDQIAESIFKDSANTEKNNTKGEKNKTNKYSSSVGKNVMIDGIYYTVVGVVVNTQGGRQIADAIAPITTMQSIYQLYDKVQNLAIIAPPTSKKKDAEAYEKQLVNNIANLYKFDKDDDSALRKYNLLDDYLQTMSIIGSVNMFFIIIALGTLFSGIVSVSNILIITVKERTKEIGVRKALGARPSSIVQLVVLEAVLIISFFGILGMSIGVLLLELVNNSLQQSATNGQISFLLNPSIAWQMAVGALLILIIAGLFAGYMPAKRASSIRPIEALMEE
ncbi:MAG: ABC transporter permease [Bacteroidales bacterium]